jgi:hypothetical protein
VRAFELEPPRCQHRRNFERVCEQQLRLRCERKFGNFEGRVERERIDRIRDLGEFLERSRLLERSGLLERGRLLDRGRLLE